MSSGSDTEGTSLQLGSGKKRQPKRPNHNELERKRRHAQKLRLFELRDVIPTLQLEKPSTVLIMTKAKEYIEMLTRRNEELEREVSNLKRAFSTLPGGAAVLASQSPQTASPGHGHLQGHGNGLPQSNGFPFTTPPLKAQEPSQDEYEFKGFIGMETAGEPSRLKYNSQNQPSPDSAQDPAERHLVPSFVQTPSDWGAAPTPSGPQSTSQSATPMQVTPSSTRLEQPRTHPQPFEPMYKHEPGIPNTGHGQFANAVPTAAPPTAQHQHQHQHQNSGLATTGDGFTFVPAMPTPEDLSSQNVVCRHCNNMYYPNQGFMLDCDRCHSWYHARCVGMDPKSIPTSWICAECVRRYQ